jgi:hypothetical protein
LMPYGVSDSATCLYRRLGPILGHSKGARSWP